ncbi:EthD family reductase [Thalassobaculum sp.]|uniref:EthD family reductase n=1 Tax=Thalassobaculum sp. TaxID=2022740 RepID=UPI0032EAE541
MITRMGLLRKRDDMSTDEFRRHWRESHGPLAAQLSGLRRYHQNHVVDREQRAISYTRGGLDFDGFSELWFDDLPSMSAAFAGEHVKRLGEDESQFIGDLKLITAIQHVVVPTPSGTPLLKRMSTLKRRPDVSPEDFKREWFDVHSFLVRRLPQVKGYTQNLIFDRSHGRGRPATYGELPIDGIVELWFEDLESLNTAFASDAGKTLMTHATEFISEISTFLVDTHEVV